MNTVLNQLFDYFVKLFSLDKMPQNLKMLSMVFSDVVEINHWETFFENPLKREQINEDYLKDYIYRSLDMTENDSSNRETNSVIN